MEDIRMSDIYIKRIDSMMHSAMTTQWNHNHPKRSCAEIYFVLNGEYNMQYNDNESITFRENDFIFIPPNREFFSNSVSLPTEMIAVFFQSELPQNDDMNIFSTIFYLQSCNKTIKNAFKNISQLFLLKHPGFQLDIKKEMYKIFSIVLDTIHKNSHDKYNYYLVKPAHEYIKAHFLKDDISIEHLADLCKITPSYFTKSFKNIFGVSPKKYIIDLKMNVACDYISNTTISIKDISKTLGYEDITYFTASFKKHYGVSPREYRKRYMSKYAYVR